MRVVSLLASGTEIVCALGLRACLVGRSHECDNPPEVAALPACSSPAFETTASSGAIDAEVRRRLGTGEPLYYIHSDLIEQLNPDLIISQAHCQVCAVTPDDVHRAGCGMPAQVLGLSIGSLAGIYDGVRQIAKALEVPAQGELVVKQMAGRIDAVTAAVARRAVPSVVLLEWTDPIFAMGNWGPELIEAAGGRPLLGAKGQHSAAIEWAAVVQANPDVLIIAPCGFDLPRTRSELPRLRSLPHWSELRAVRTGRVVLADGNRYFNRSGTTVVETVEMLANILHGPVPGVPAHADAWCWCSASSHGADAK
ncbi:MAG: ABC transporter substrate-binding protein [Phycisphaerales bacterium]|nr:ABC transporter substrate-binding protein [Phycisphaerales bacterium]